MSDWRKSSLCSLGDCVHVRRDGDGVALTRRVPHRLDAAPTVALKFTRAEFAAFTAGIKAGEFDDLLEPAVAESVQTDTERPDPPEPPARRSATDLRPKAAPSDPTAATPTEETP